MARSIASSGRQILEAGAEGKPEIARAVPFESLPFEGRREDAANRKDLTVEKELPVQDVRVSGKLALPEAMAEKDGLGRLLGVVLGGEALAEEWCEAQSVEEGCSGFETLKALRVSASPEGDADPPGRGPCSRLSGSVDVGLRSPWG